MNKLLLESVENAETVLCINESDPRNFGTKPESGIYKGPGGMINVYDWKVWSGSGYGQQLASSLANGKKGYSFEVTDFGCAVVVRALYHSTGSGKGIEKTYVIIFDDPKSGNGTLFASSTKWRSVANVGQAASYVTQSIQSYASSTTSI